MSRRFDSDMSKMKFRTLKDKGTGIEIGAYFDKCFKNDRYELLFNTLTGFEVLRGISGHPDPFSLDMPSMIDCGIMGHCKNKCEFCYQGDNQEPNMKFEDFKRIVDECKYHTNQIALGGRGDPNLHEDFEKIVEYARSNNVVPNYTTSGINLTDKQVEISKLCGAVAVSDYEQDFTYNSLRRFIDNGMKTNIHFIYSSVSHPLAVKILKGIDIWNGKVDLEKLNAIIFLLFKPQGRGKELLYWVPKISQIRQFSKLIKEPKCKFKVGLDSCMVNKVKKFAKFSPQQEMSIDTCESGRMSVYITPDMRLVPCSFANYKQQSVSLEHKSIEDVWNRSDPFVRCRYLLKQYPDMCPYGL